jgi:hypothetical protein
MTSRMVSADRSTIRKRNKSRMTDEQKRAVVLFASMLALAVSVGVLDKLKVK